MKHSPDSESATGGVVIIVQARMGSSRLPGKVLKPIAGRPMLSYLVERLQRVARADRFVIATSTNSFDEAIVDFCGGLGVQCTRGPEHDVLSRYVEAARKFGAGTVVRVTADCPLIDPGLIDAAIDAFGQPGERFDYLSNMLEPSWPYGMAVEVFTAAALAEAGREATDEAEREHVTPFLYRRPERYRLKSLTMEPDLSRHRWTVDTPEDFDLVSRILATLHPRIRDFTMADVLAVLAENPSWELINRHVVQKTVAPVGARS